jgi:hypothetical protein
MNVSRNLALGLYPSSNVLYLKTIFLKLALLPCSGKKGEEGVTPTLWGPLERVDATSSPLFT